MVLQTLVVTVCPISPDWRCRRAWLFHTCYAAHARFRGNCSTPLDERLHVIHKSVFCGGIVSKITIDLSLSAVIQPQIYHVCSTHTA